MTTPRSHIIPTGGSTGLDHADPGVCPIHSSVMITDGVPCQLCMQGTARARTEASPAASLAPIRRRGICVEREVLPGPVSLEIDRMEGEEPRGHASRGNYV